MSERPAYPEGEVVGPCVCGSWPGGECPRCEWREASDTRGDGADDAYDADLRLAREGEVDRAKARRGDGVEAARLASMFWRVHPAEIQDSGLTREQWYAEHIASALTRERAAGFAEGLAEGMERAANELRGLRRLLRTQSEVIDISRDDAVYAICEAAIRSLIQPQDKQETRDV